MTALQGAPQRDSPPPTRLGICALIVDFEIHSQGVQTVLWIWKSTARVYTLNLDLEIYSQGVHLEFGVKGVKTMVFLLFTKMTNDSI